MRGLNAPRPHAHGVRPFADRAAAGRLLAERVCALELHDPVVLALPRGGVVVACEVARALHAPLDLMLVRKIGAPGQPELALGAVTDGDHPEVLIDTARAGRLGATQDYLEHEVHEALLEIARRRVRYLGHRHGVPVRGRDVVVVDDGVATGSSMTAALQALRRAGSARLVVAVPVAPPESLEELRAIAASVVCLEAPADFGSVSQYYADFRQLDDDEVVAALERTDEAVRSGPATGG